jgi:3-deoxy-D-manno-octulosonate 8-phosphate phosphatase (KDO 8-P phosphatase)
MLNSSTSTPACKKLAPTAISDLAWFKQCLANTQLVETLKKITCIVCDVDGTLTAADIYVTSTGEGGRTFSVQDGYAIRHAQTTGLMIVLMSGKANASTIARGKDLGIPEAHCIVGMLTKSEAIKKLQKETGLSIQQTMIIGDDIIDLMPKQQGVVSLFVAPANAPFYIQNNADLIICRDGGNHAVRLFLDLLLFIQHKHFAQDEIAACL